MAKRRNGKVLEKDPVQSPKAVLAGPEAHAEPVEQRVDGELPSGLAQEIAKMSPEEIAAARLVFMARGPDTWQGFAAFFQLVTGKKLKGHSLDQVMAAYSARESGKYAGFMAFRGSAKTTVWVTFLAYQVGKHPEKSNLLIQVGDDIALDNAERVADIIANNPGWQSVFPHVVPDREKGWGASGYEVKISEKYMDYQQWRLLNSERKDPTFVGVGYKSGAIIGKRPSGVLLVDDICDENNTSSDREMAKVEKILTGTIFPTIKKDTWVIFVFTPWKENDPVVKVTSLPTFTLMKTPVYVPDPEGVDLDGEKVKLTWPSMFDVEEIKRRKINSGQIEFARMYLLDLSQSTNTVFKYQPFPSNAIHTAKWPMWGGVDYAGTMNMRTNTDFFAICYVAAHPEGSVIVVDGVVDRCTQSQAESYALRAQSLFPLWQNMVVEGDGKGEEFIQVMMRHPLFRQVPMKTGGKGKQERLVRQMGPWLESGRVKISDANTPFLNELRRELDQYPLCAHDDCLDALYWALRAVPHLLVMPADQERLPERQPYGARRQQNPFNSLGRK